MPFGKQKGSRTAGTMNTGAARCCKSPRKRPRVLAGRARSGGRPSKGPRSRDGRNRRSDTASWPSRVGTVLVAKSGRSGPSRYAQRPIRAGIAGSYPDLIPGPALILCPAAGQLCEIRAIPPHLAVLAVICGELSATGIRFFAEILGRRGSRQVGNSGRAGCSVAVFRCSCEKRQIVVSAPPKADLVKPPIRQICVKHNISIKAIYFIVNLIITF